MPSNNSDSICFFSHSHFQRKLVLEDLASFDPEIYSSVRKLLDYDGDVNDLYLDFTVTNNFLGETKTVLLKPDGDKIAVSKDNREEYARLFMEYYLERSVSEQVCPDDLCLLLHPRCLSFNHSALVSMMSLVAFGR